MLHLTIDEFVDMEPCGTKYHLDHVRHLFPITTKEGVHELAKLWKHEAEAKPIDYHSDLEWLTCRILPRNLRLKAAAKGSLSFAGRNITNIKTSETGYTLWCWRNLSLELIEELLTEVTSDR